MTASKDTLKLLESRNAMDTIRAHAVPEANIIYGTAYDDALGEYLRVTVVATGLPRPRPDPPHRPANVMRVGLRTGTNG